MKSRKLALFSVLLWISSILAASSSTFLTGEEGKLALKEYLVKSIQNSKDSIAEVASGLKDISEATKSKNKSLRDLQKIFGGIASSMVTVSAVVSIVSAFLPQEDSPELEFMKENFDSVFNSLNRMEDKVDHLGALVTHETTKAVYSEYQRIIASLYDDWQAALQSNKSSLERVNRAVFIRQYSQTYKSSALHLLRGMIGHYNGELTHDLLETTRDRYKCEELRIRKLCSTVGQAIIQGVCVEGAYYSYLKKQEKVEELKTWWPKRLQLLNERCESTVQQCHNSWKQYVPAIINNVYEQHKTTRNGFLATRLYQSISSAFGQREWLVFVYNAVKKFKDPIVSVSVYNARGDVSETWNHDRRHVLVVSQDLYTMPTLRHQYIANTTSFSTSLQTCKPHPDVNIALATSIALPIYKSGDVYHLTQGAELVLGLDGGHQVKITINVPQQCETTAVFRFSLG